MLTLHLQLFQEINNCKLFISHFHKNNLHKVKQIILNHQYPSKIIKNIDNIRLHHCLNKLSQNNNCV